MSVKARKRVEGNGRLEYKTTAADVLKPDHPVHNHFIKWLDGAEPSKRKAREFLQAFPNYREVSNG